MLSVRARVVSRIEKCDENGVKISEQIDLDAVRGEADPGSENLSFSKFTPIADFHIMVTNPSAFGRLVPGKIYYIDVRPE